MSLLFDALDERFDDLQECKEISEHGCASCAPHGFIYYYETRKFFLEHEDEIEDYLETIYGDELLPALIKDNQTISTLMNAMVWLVIEDYCTCKYGKHLDTQALAV